MNPHELIKQEKRKLVSLHIKRTGLNELSTRRQQLTNEINLKKQKIDAIIDICKKE